MTTPATEKPSDRFADLGLTEPLLQAVEKLGYETATPIQAAAIPVILRGEDLIGCAQTGTGKTAAFTLPTLDRLLELTKGQHNKKPPVGGKHHPSRRNKPERPIRALVLSPTRELAAQIGASLQKYGRFTPLQHTVVFGGVSQHHQVKALRRGVDALIATPGRLLDLMDQGHIDLTKVEFLVFDEADQMLDMGFLPALKRIVKHVPQERQTLMFSATMPAAIRELAQQWLHRPRSIEVAPVSTPADRIEQSVHFVDKKRKPDLLLHYLTNTSRDKTLVFSRTKYGADKIAKKLKKAGLSAEAIHGDKSQGQRNRALDRFRGNNPPVLIATDIAARGLDIRGVSHVVNFDLPETPEVYVHRIGRTARAGESGVAVSFCAGDERGQLKQVERLMKQPITVAATVPGFEPMDPITEPAPKGRNKKGRGRGGRGQAGGDKPRGLTPVGKKKDSKPKRYGKPGAKSATGGGTHSSGGGNSGGGSKPSGQGSGQGGYKKKRKPTRVKGSTAPTGGRPKRKSKPKPAGNQG